MRRSSKRRKTIEAYRKGDTIIVAIPARMSKREEERVVAEMVSKLGKDDLRLTSIELMSRALELNTLYLGGKATVDAYDGTVTLYQWDTKDPVLKTWSKAFPGTVKPKVKY